MTYVNIKHGRQEPEYKHPVLKEVRRDQLDYGLSRTGHADPQPTEIRWPTRTLRKAISKKKEALIAQNHDAFITGSVENGLSEKDAEDIWNLIVKFAGYGFNKSHSTAYALVAYQTAFLKAHYPVEFMAALLSSDISGRNFKRKDALVEHMEDCDRMGIEIVAPDVNHARRISSRRVNSLCTLRHQRLRGSTDFIEQNERRMEASATSLTLMNSRHRLLQ